MSARYFYAQNATHSFEGIVFTVYAVIGGCAMGIYATENETEQATLDRLATNPRNALKSISEAEYQTFVKKNPTLSQVTSRPSPKPVQPSHVPPDAGSRSPVVTTKAAPPMVGDAPAVVEGPGTVAPAAADSPGEPGPALPPVESAVNTGEVEAAPAPQPTTKPSKKARKGS